MPDGTIRLRRATRDDTAAVTACVCRAYLPWIPIVGRQPGPMLEDYATVIARHQVHVAERDGEVIGVLVLDVERERVFVDNVCVDPSLQRAGVGRLMLGFAEDEARRRGHASIDLSTHETMASNLAMYTRLGYHVVDRRVVGGFPRVFMQKAVH